MIFVCRMSDVRCPMSGEVTSDIGHWTLDMQKDIEHWTLDIAQ
jgi:hypothetical protein